MLSKEPKTCYFCQHSPNYIDFKDVELLNKYISMYKKILPRRYNGNCQKHQKMLERAIKNARLMGLLPFKV